ncbi:hypothetical protein TYRP_015673 [Tyrophagus putrescentiae]|nr:hypothetical protein TYRP_022588 [Tyrophagus putrescentiae]KAH9391748.1 hypothetical protein TYRP_022596 [Tyrophagus putrescentiae]KAH9402909.1 hypothetical protein TYRP_015673 [Tyrophagus putrescentiae]
MAPLNQRGNFRGGNFRSSNWRNGNNWCYRGTPRGSDSLPRRVYSNQDIICIWHFELDRTKSAEKEKDKRQKIR